MEEGGTNQKSEGVRLADAIAFLVQTFGSLKISSVGVQEGTKFW